MTANSRPAGVMTARNETSVSVSRRRSVPPHEIVMLDKSFPLSTISRFPSVKSMSRDSMSGAIAFAAAAMPSASSAMV